MKFNLETLKSPKNVLQTLLSILFHLSICFVGVALLSNLLTFLSFKLAFSVGYPVTIQQLHWTLTGIHGFPAQAAVGLLLGFILAKYMRREVMVWIWLFPLAFLCIGILFIVKDYSSVWSHFFGNGCNVTERCFDQMLFTLPLVSSVSYSLGARIRRPVGKGSEAVGQAR